MVGLPPSWDQRSLASSFNTMTLQPPRNNDGYFNSGASSHMASDAGILSTSSQSPVHSSIVVGNGSLLPVTSTGSASLPRNFHLNNVLVAPNLIKNLISLFASLPQTTIALLNLTLLVVCEGSSVPEHDRQVQ